jgi:hypothetical protein
MPSAALRRPRDPSALVWLGASLAGFLLLCGLERRFVADDAWITARYADNLEGGLGFVWNAGGPRVEGFSNPALVLAEAAGRLAGLESVTVARVAGVACGVALLLLLHRRGPAVVGVQAARVALGLTALYPPLALWAVGGLETLPAALAITAGVLYLAATDAARRDHWRAGAAFAVLPWLRPEGIVVALAVAVFAEAPGVLRRATRPRALRQLATVAGLPVASQIVLTGSRLVVYGHVFPNPVLTKTRAGAGLQVLDRFIHEARPVLIVAALGLLLARGRRRLLAVPPLVYGLGSIGTLDSVNFFSRYFLPTWPLCALLAGIAVTAVVRRVGERARPVAYAAALALAAVELFAPPGSAHGLRDWSRWYASCREGPRRSAAAWLWHSTARDARFSISDAGLVPATAGRRAAIDQLWLNEPVLQRTGPLDAKRHADYVLRRAPDAILLASASPRALRPLYRTDGALAADPRLRRYRLAAVARSRGLPGCHYALFEYRNLEEPLSRP